MAKAKLNVRGMHCPSCSMLIEDVLGDERGVHSIKADFKSGVVEVEYDEGKIDIDKIESIIAKEGYEVG